MNSNKTQDIISLRRQKYERTDTNLGKRYYVKKQGIALDRRQSFNAYIQK